MGNFDKQPTVTGRDLAASAILVARGSHAGSSLDLDLIRLATQEIDHITATESSGFEYRETNAASQIIRITQLEGEK